MKIIFTCFFSLACLMAMAQETHPAGFLFIGKKPFKNYMGVKLGYASNTFSDQDHPYFPVSGNGPLFSWNAGISRDFFTSKLYNARAELSYTQKGAKETFGNENVSIRSKNKLQYIQLSVIPLVIKSGFRKISPYLAVGGYIARRLAIKSSVSIDDANWETDPIMSANIAAKSDYGYSLGIGIYMWQRPILELRYEGGLPSMSSHSTIRNRSISLSISI